MLLYTRGVEAEGQGYIRKCSSVCPPDLLSLLMLSSEDVQRTCEEKKEKKGYVI